MASCGTITVREPEPDFDPSLVEVTECGLSPTDVTPDEEVAFTATVANPNDTSARATIAWFASDVGGAELTSIENNLIPSGGASMTARIPIELTEAAGSVPFSSGVTARVVRDSVSEAGFLALPSAASFGIDRATAATAGAGIGAGLVGLGLLR